MKSISPKIELANAPHKVPIEKDKKLTAKLLG